MSGQLSLVGLGLSMKFITQTALKTLRESDIIYFDTYTSISCDINRDEIEKISGKPVIPASREMLESKIEEIINKLREGKRISIATIGDPLIATTHVSLITTIKNLGFPVNIIPGISVFCYIISKSILSS
ncbi:MAG: SAM-dependent methyltransferase, partial [Sulfolobaceae archaeon]